VTAEPSAGDLQDKVVLVSGGTQGVGAGWP